MATEESPARVFRLGLGQPPRLAIKGEDEEFPTRYGAAYRRMTECMPDNGIQVIMFTHHRQYLGRHGEHRLGFGLQVTAAWYVVTETDSALREGTNVKGTVYSSAASARRAQNNPR